MKKNITKIKIEKETKTSIAALVLSLFIAIISVVFFFWENEIIVRIDVTNIVESNEAVNGKIDEIIVDEGKISIKGWAFREVPYMIDRVVLLRNVDDKNEVWKLNTILEEKTILSDGFGERAYANAGFSANGNVKKEMQNKEYEIVIYFRDIEGNYLFNTEKRIFLPSNI